MAAGSKMVPLNEHAEECRLQVEIEVAFPSSCTFSTVDAENASADLFVMDGVCRCKVKCDGSVYRYEQETCKDCLCNIFDRYDCPPTLEKLGDGRSVLSFHLVDRARLTDLIDDLKSVSEHVRLLKIVEIAADNGEISRSITFDLKSLTETQRETLEVAVTNGYYDDPQTISLEELAAKLDVTKSAVTRRLNRVEANLVSQVVQRD